MSMICDHTCAQYTHEHNECETHCYEDLVCMDCGYLQYTRVAWFDGGGTGIVQYDYTYVSPMWHGRMMEQAKNEINNVLDLYEDEIKKKKPLEFKISALESSISRAVRELKRQPRFWLASLSDAIRLVSEVGVHRERNENALAAINQVMQTHASISRYCDELIEVLAVSPRERDVDDIPF